MNAVQREGKMFDKISDPLSLVIASVAAIVSIISVIISSKNVITTTISANRIRWIEDIRSLVCKLLNEYRQPSPNKSVLVETVSLILLYLNRYNKGYEFFVISIKKCITAPYSEKNEIDILDATQDVLNSVWRRMKREAGIFSCNDRAISYFIDKEMKNKKAIPQFENNYFIEK